MTTATRRATPGSARGVPLLKGRGTRRTRTIPTLVALVAATLLATPFPAPAQWVSLGPEGVDVAALVVHPTTPTTLYAGTYGSGIFQSTDGGASWSPVNTGLTGLTCGRDDCGVDALAVDPTTPTTLYVGYFLADGGGVFKSTDGGGSWSAANTGLTCVRPSYQLRACTVRTLALDPQTPTTLYAVTDRGVFVLRPTKIGVYRNGGWYLDTNGNGRWDGCGPDGPDACFGWGGDPADKVVLGDWNGSGTTKIGVYRNGAWYLDRNGNGVWDGCGTDACYGWEGDPADVPIVGRW